jgi:hypothetical protein
MNCWRRLAAVAVAAVVAVPRCAAYFLLLKLIHDLVLKSVKTNAFLLHGNGIVISSLLSLKATLLITQPHTV